MAVQLAKARGAYVITTAGPRNLEFVVKASGHRGRSPCSMSRVPAAMLVPVCQAVAGVTDTSFNTRSFIRGQSVVCKGRSLRVFLSRLQELGADEAIDYTRDRFDDILKGRPVDAVIDAVGGELATAAC